MPDTLVEVRQRAERFMLSRNDRIRRDYQKLVAAGHGDGALSRLARLYGVSRQRMWQIVHRPEASDA